MKKIAFVVKRYGKDVNGGAEYHCRMLAERLRAYYEVDVLTTRIKSYKTLINEFAEGLEVVDGINVYRFTSEPEQVKKAKGVNIVRKMRRLLFRLNKKALTPFTSLLRCNKNTELECQKGESFYSAGLISFLQENIGNYQKVIFITYNSPIVVLGIEACKNKSVFIPTAHNEGALFQSIMVDAFSLPSYIAFNTASEQKLCKNIFGKHLAPNGIVGVGIDEPEPENWEKVKEKYSINTDNFILYLGRLDYAKLGNLLEYFVRYKAENPNDEVKLFLAGEVLSDKVNHNDIIYLGFVSETEKAAFIQHAKVMVNPSNLESLSLIVLESLHAQVPVLVNGNCDVLKEHIDRSGAGYYYKNYNQFKTNLSKLLSSSELRVEMGIKGKAYVDHNYKWDVIIDKFKDIIEN